MLARAEQQNCARSRGLVVALGGCVPWLAAAGHPAARRLIRLELAVQPVVRVHVLVVRAGAALLLAGAGARRAAEASQPFVGPPRGVDVRVAFVLHEYLLHA